MLKASLKPPPVRSIKLWAGLYGGHYDIIVFFKEKPTNRMSYEEDTLPRGKYVDVYEEDRADNVWSDMSLPDFQEWFPDVDLSRYTQPNGRPKDTEVPYKDLFEIELTMPLDEFDGPVTLHTDVDWPQR
jgi:hypothetical protein